MNLDSPPEARPPVARREPHESVVWETKLIDDYRWLHDRSSAEVMEHLKAENAFTDAVFEPLTPLRETIFQEIKSRVKETDLSVPVIDGPWAYYSRTTEGEQYASYCRRPAPADGSQPGPYAEDDTTGESVLLDENSEAGEDDYFALGLFEVSPDHRFLLWGADHVGDEKYGAQVRDLETGVDIVDGLDGLSPGSAWALDNRTFFYVRQDDAHRPHEVWRHVVGDDPSQDVLVFREDDERFFVGVGRDKDDAYIHIVSSSKISDEIRVIPADAPTEDPRLIAPRRQGVEYSAAHVGDRFVIRTNDGAENFRVVTAPEEDPGPDNWTELIAGSDAATISGIDVCSEFLTLYERAEGSTRIRLRYWDDGRMVSIDQPENPSTVWAGNNPNFDSPLLRYGYSSMVTPPSLFLFDPQTGDRRLLKQQEVLGDFDPSRYRTERVWSQSPDGTSVPISLVWRVEPSEAGDSGGDQPPGQSTRPCVLYAYGAYEASMDPEFSSARLSLLDRGFVFAIAHARGGGEMGRGWYRDGKFEHKQNTFIDVEWAARHLIDTGWTSADQLVLRGGSAGGLMAGAVMNRAPELFAAVVAEVPFVDALNTILDPTQPLTVTEWEEWGNPAEDRHIFDAMLAYSPYENTSPKQYPSVLATAGLHDSRVNYWEAAKWVQRLREKTTSSEPVLLWTELAAGHGGPSGRYDAWHDEARVLAYICVAVGAAAAI